jgi:hypothetical protein
MDDTVKAAERDGAAAEAEAKARAEAEAEAKTEAEIREAEEALAADIAAEQEALRAAGRHVDISGVVIVNADEPIAGGE